MSHAAFARELLLRHGKIPTMVFLVVATVCGALAAAGDLRWLVVMLMAVCLVAPLILAWLYMYHGMRPVTALNVAPHRLKAEGSTLTAEIIEEAEDEKGNKTEIVRIAHSLNAGDFGKYYIGIDCITLSSGKEWLWIPQSAFEEPSRLTDFLNQLKKK